MNIQNLIQISKDGKNDSDPHAILLYSLVVSSKAKVIIELGVRNGGSTLPLVLGAKENNGIVYSVDIVNCSYEIPNECQKNNIFIQEDSLEFLSNWNKMGYTPDIVFIDDWHAYDHVKKELEILDTIVSPQTIILLHDLMYGDTCPFYHTDLTLKDGQWANGGPYRAVAELNPQFWEFSTLPWGNGLTILRKKYSNKYKRK
jgi:predicted O-methyltransferase YrrM